MSTFKTFMGNAMLKAVWVVEQHKPEKVIRLYAQHLHDFFWTVRPGASSCFFQQGIRRVSHKYLNI